MAWAAQRSAPLHNAWIGIQKSWVAEQLVFLDESAANERTGDRKYGWSPEGTIYSVAHMLKRSERWSILPVLAVDGYLSYFIF